MESKSFRCSNCTLSRLRRGVRFWLIASPLLIPGCVASENAFLLNPTADSHQQPNSVVVHNGGTIKPNRTQPAPYVPANYTFAPNPVLAKVELARWWEAFQSASLNRVLGFASAKHNRTLSVAQNLKVGGDSEGLYLQSAAAKEHLLLHSHDQHLANTAIAYFDLVLAAEHLGHAERNAVLAEQLLDVAKHRFTSGEIGRADVLLAEAEVARSQSLKSELQRAWRTSDVGLRVLVGYDLPTDQLGTNTLDSFSAPMLIDVGQPSELLHRRHDLLAVKSEINQLSDQSGQDVWYPYPVGASDQILKMLSEHYQRLIDEAYSQVESAMSQLEALANEVSEREQSKEKLNESYTLVAEQYTYGRATMVNVLDVQRNLLEATMMHATSRHQLLSSHVRLYLAAGGGGAPISEQPHHIASPNYEHGSTVAAVSLSAPVNAQDAVSDYSLSAPQDAYTDGNVMTLLPPVERLDELGRGTVTVVTLGQPKLN